MMKAYLCIDLKTFFASVECVERKLDPFAVNLVVADPSRGKGALCLAVSPKMKEQGVHNRCRIFEIPDNISYITAMPRMNLYMQYSADIYGIYLKYISREDIHVYSIDEAFLDVSEYLQMYSVSAKELARMILQDIYTTTGITATVGIGTNLYLAKIALDITAKHAKDNMGVLDEQLYRETLWHHKPVSDFWQVGRGISKRLEKYSVADMYTVEYPSLKPIEITKKKIPQGQLADYLIASASCFPAFPIHYFNNQGYIDGGYYDNLPIHLAFKMGATEIIAVELNVKTFTHEEYTHRPNIKYIAPLNDNGGFLDFDGDVLAHRQLMGYYDTMKAYGRYLGFKYTLYPKIDEALCQHIYYSILSYEAKINRESIKKHIRIFDIMPFTHLLLEHVNKLTLDIPDYTLIILDILAELYKIDPYQIYQFHDINETIVEKFENTLKECCDIFQTKGYSVTRLTKFLTDLGTEELICFIYLKLVDNTLWESNWIMPMFSKECLCAIYLYQYKTQKDRLNGLAI